MRSLVFVLSFLFLSITGASLTFAEEFEEVKVIETLDGQVLYGRILRELEEGLLFHTTDGQTLTIQYNNIKDITVLTELEEEVVEEEPDVIVVQPPPVVESVVVVEEEVPLAEDPKPAPPKRNKRKRVRVPGSRGTGLKVTGWVFVGVSIAMFVIGTMAYLANEDSYSYDDCEYYGNCSRDDELSELSTGLWVTGGVFLTAGIVMIVIGKIKGRAYLRRLREAQRAEGLSVAPLLGPDYSGFSLRWNF